MENAMVPASAGNELDRENFLGELNKVMEEALIRKSNNDELMQLLHMSAFTIWPPGPVAMVHSFMDAAQKQASASKSEIQRAMEILNYCTSLDVCSAEIVNEHCKLARDALDMEASAHSSARKHHSEAGSICSRFLTSQEEILFPSGNASADQEKFEKPALIIRECNEFLIQVRRLASSDVDAAWANSFTDRNSPSYGGIALLDLGDRFSSMNLDNPRDAIPYKFKVASAFMEFHEAAAKWRGGNGISPEQDPDRDPAPATPIEDNRWRAF